MIAANFLGLRVMRAVESVLTRIPFVKSIYSSVKQVSDTLLSPHGNAFRKALLVEWPYPGCWTIAFQTGLPASAVTTHLASVNAASSRSNLSDDGPASGAGRPKNSTTVRTRSR